MTIKFKLIQVTPLQQNSTLIWDTDSKEAIITDVGGDIDKIQNELDKLDVNLKEIWITHGHFDHIGAVHEFSTLKKLPVHGPHINDKFWIDNIETITKNYNLPIGLPFTPKKWLLDNDELFIGKYKFKVLHLPGHSPGSIGFYNKESNLLIAGDVLFRESIGRTDLPQGNYQTLINSIKSKLLYLSDNTIVISGHGPLTSIGYEREYNRYLQ